MNQDDLQAKIKFIEAYFIDFERKIAFLDELNKSKHRDEALLLCCCYIEAMGNDLYSSEYGSHKNFVRILKEYGDEEIFSYLHPIQLLRSLEEANDNKVKKIGEKLKSTLEGAEKKLYTETELIQLTNPILNGKELDRLEKNLWKGTFASIAYKRIRCELVHSAGALDVSFDKTTFKGRPVPNLDFNLLYPQLSGILKKMKKLSLDTSTWFGHEL